MTLIVDPSTAPCYVVIEEYHEPYACAVAITSCTMWAKLGILSQCCYVIIILLVEVDHCTFHYRCTLIAMLNNGARA